MLGGQVAVFLSCSDKFKHAVAWPVRDALSEHGMRGVIVSDEPGLPGASGDRAAKVEAYLDASSAFVALCTPDYGLSDGTTYPRASIIYEIERARGRPRLRDRCQVLRSPGVQLPSSISPTFDGLDTTRPISAAEVILKQLEEWGQVPSAAGPPVPVPAVGADGTGDLEALLAGLQPADHDEALRGAYGLLRGRDTDGRRRIAGTLYREILADEASAGGGPGRQLAAAALLQAISRLDASLVSAEMIETLASCPRYLPRSCAANLLHGRAIVAPLDVPVEILGRLALPDAEDWYVWAPALAAAKELVLSRRDAYVIFESLSASAAAQDRHAVAQALLDIAAVRPAAVAADLAERLRADADPLVAAKAGEVITMIGQAADTAGEDGYGHFAL
jgi:hypothetical protein